MVNNNQTKISRDSKNRIITVSREFNAGADLVWQAWTERDLLEQWWAPKPWLAETRIMEFHDGGRWLYAMKGPDGTKVWSLVEFHSIKKPQSFEATSCFCDEDGKKNPDFPTLHWKNVFTPNSNGTTTMEIEIRIDKEADFLKIVEMGFEGGFSMALGNLDDLLRR